MTTDINPTTARRALSALVIPSSSIVDRTLSAPDITSIAVEIELMAAADLSMPPDKSNLLTTAKEPNMTSKLPTPIAI